MFQDPNCLDKFCALLIGVGVAGTTALLGVPAPTGVLEGITAATGLSVLLRDRTQAKTYRTFRDLRTRLDSDWQTWAQTSSHRDPGLTAHCVASMEELLDHMTFTGTEIVAAAQDPDAVAAAFVDRAAFVYPEAYEDRGPHHRDTALPRDFLRKLTRAAYARLLEDTDFLRTLEPAYRRAVLTFQADTRRYQDEARGERAAIRAQLDRMEAMIASGPAAAARAQGVSEAAIIALARRIAPAVRDRDEAMIELTRAVDIAADLARRGEQGSNTDAFADHVLKELARLTAAGDLDAAAAFALEETDRAEAALSQILAAAIDAQLLARDAQAAARLIVKRLTLDAPPDLFEALRVERRTWYERGRDKGLALDLEVAIALARETLARAANADQRGTALNLLGIALQTLGARESGTARLTEAVAAFRAALEERRQDRVPLHWAATQNNLGNALSTLGARESGTSRLTEAVAAYRDALEEQRRDLVPLDWAGTQNNLGNALLTLGKRESGTARLTEAVAAYRAALEERRRELVPLDWAGTQTNLGTALRALGERESGTARLIEAVAAYRAALEELRQDHVPLDWAATQNNLGTALRALGERDSGTARLTEAVAAYRAALMEYRRDRVPLDWASTRYNIAGVHLAIFDKTGDPADLDLAQFAVTEAREVFLLGAPYYLEMADDLLAEIAARRP